MVSTTVVEVGVDHPKATVIVVEHAERFGLSQLHQLRGRVGRSDLASFCFLVAAHMGSPESRRRLKVMEESQDGFKIAEADLEIRGSGEFLGTRQSGLPQFQVARLPRDLKVLVEARNRAKKFVMEDPVLATCPALKRELEERLFQVDLN